MTKRFIAIAGNIGSGKTTLTNMLAEKYGWKPYFESAHENPYLPDFYKNMKRWSLPLQLYFLSQRLEAHQTILESSGSAVQDRSIYEDIHIFARTLHQDGHLDARDFASYQRLYQNVTRVLEPPDMIVYIHRSVECLKERIRERGRDYERDMPEAYLHRLNDCYEQWIGNYRLGKVLTVRADDLDLKWNPRDFNYVCESIENSLEQPELCFEA